MNGRLPHLLSRKRLLIGVLAVIVVLLGTVVYFVAIPRLALTIIEREAEVGVVDGEISVHYQSSSPSSLWALKWARHVIFVLVYDADLSVRDMEHLAQIPRLHMLFLQNSPISVDTLQPLSRSRSLGVLNLGGTNVDHRIWDLLNSIPTLYELIIDETQLEAIGLLQNTTDREGQNETSALEAHEAQVPQLLPKGRQVIVNIGSLYFVEEDEFLELADSWSEYGIILRSPSVP